MFWIAFRAIDTLVVYTVFVSIGLLGDSQFVVHHEHKCLDTFVFQVSDIIESSAKHRRVMQY